MYDCPPPETEGRCIWRAWLKRDPERGLCATIFAYHTRDAPEAVALIQSALHVRWSVADLTSKGHIG